MSSTEAVLLEALRRVNEHVMLPELRTVSADTNIFASIDSMAIVDLLLESEALLEDETGNYVSLATDKIFDASASPLRRWSEWIDFVESRHAE